MTCLCVCAISFNSDISNWDVSSVTIMSFMFVCARAMYGMFVRAYLCVCVARTSAPVWESAYVLALCPRVGAECLRVRCWNAVFVFIFLFLFCCSVLFFIYIILFVIFFVFCIYVPCVRAWRVRAHLSSYQHARLLSVRVWVLCACACGVGMLSFVFFFFCLLVLLFSFFFYHYFSIHF